MRAILITMVAIFAMLAGSAQAAVTTCNGLGVTTSNVQYGTCNTDQNGGSGSMPASIFSNDGMTMSLWAKTQKGSEQVAAYWQSNGPVAATQQICVSVRNVSQPVLKGNGSLYGYLKLSYNGAVQSVTQDPITGPYDVELCAPVPPDATNVWWQLLVVAGGDKPSSQVQASVTLSSVRVS